MPPVRWLPEAGSAPRSPSGNTVTLVQSPPVAACSASSDATPHSSLRSRMPWEDGISQTGVCERASASSNRTA
jgi:hypothetical protein